MTNEEKEYFQYYYLTRYVLYADNYSALLEEIKERDFNFHHAFLDNINEIILNNSNNSIVTENTKYKIQEIIWEILKLYRGKIVYSHFNNLVNEIKINLNNSSLYFENYYLADEFSYKLNKDFPVDIVHCYDNVIKNSIMYDYHLYSTLLFEEMEIDNNIPLEYYLYSINTYLYDIENVEKNPIFIRNVKKIVNYNLEISRKMCKENDIPYYTAAKIKKMSRKILKRIKE